MRNIKLTEEQYKALKTILVDCVFNTSFLDESPINEMSWRHLKKEEKCTLIQLSELQKVLGEEPVTESRMYKSVNRSRKALEKIGC